MVYEIGIHGESVWVDEDKLSQEDEMSLARWRKSRRDRLAAQFTAAWISSGLDKGQTWEDIMERCCRDGIKAADKLIELLDKD